MCPILVGSVDFGKSDDDIILMPNLIKKSWTDFSLNVRSMQNKRVERVYRLSSWMITLGEYINVKPVF